jgi:hypothetical protein
MRKAVCTIFFIVCVCSAFHSHAQLLVPLQARQYAFTYTNGWYDKTPVFSIEAARAFHVHIGKLVNEYTTLFFDFADRTKFQKDNTYQFIYGGQGYILKVHSFKVLLRKTFTVNRYISDEFRGTFIGGELDIAPGIYKKKYFAALDFYYGDSFTGHVVADQQVQHVLKDVESGWITPHFGTIKLGVNVGYFIKENFLLQGHIDYTLMKPEKLVQSPNVYGTIGVTYIFNRKPLPLPPIQSGQ